MKNDIGKSNGECKMTNQKVFDMLSELECFFYYKRDCLNPTLDEIHDKINDCLLAWSEYTGCTNDTKEA